MHHARVPAGLRQLSGCRSPVALRSLSSMQPCAPPAQLRARAALALVRGVRCCGHRPGARQVVRPAAEIGGEYTESYKDVDAVLLNYFTYKVRVRRKRGATFERRLFEGRLREARDEALVRA